MKGSRKNVTHACVACQKEKRKCDGILPCARCSEKGLECVAGQQRKRGRKRALEVLSDMTIVLSTGRTACMEKCVMDERQEAALSLLLDYGGDSLRDRPEDVARACGVGGDMSRGFVTFRLPTHVAPAAVGVGNYLEDAVVEAAFFPPDLHFPFPDEDPSKHVGFKCGPIPSEEDYPADYAWFIDFEHLLWLCVKEGGACGKCQIMKIRMPPAVIKEEEARSPLDFAVYTITVVLDRHGVARWGFFNDFSGHLGKTLSNPDVLVLDLPLDFWDLSVEGNAMSDEFL